MKFRFDGNNTNEPFRAHDCLPHKLLIAKLEVYGLDKPCLNLVNEFLEVSILGPLLFNIFIIDIFLHFADDNALFFCRHNLSVILKILEYAIKIFLMWFNLNSLKANPWKFSIYYYLLSLGP